MQTTVVETDRGRVRGSLHEGVHRFLGVPNAAGNYIGTLNVPLPLGEGDPAARLPLLAAATAEAKRSPVVAAEPLVRAWLGQLGPVRQTMEQQRLVNLSETYLPGPRFASPCSALPSSTCCRSPRSPATSASPSWRSPTPAASRSPCGPTPTSSPTSTCWRRRMERDWRVLSGSPARV